MERCILQPGPGATGLTQRMAAATRKYPFKGGEAIMLDCHECRLMMCAISAWHCHKEAFGSLVRESLSEYERLPRQYWLMCGIALKLAYEATSKRGGLALAASLVDDILAACSDAVRFHLADQVVGVCGYDKGPRPLMSCLAYTYG